MLKGTTKIELTNVKTGETEVIEKENMVTNAVNDALMLNPFAARFKTPALYWYSRNEMFPICPNLIGGILLYENALEEDPDKYYAASDNPLVGYSSNNVNGTTDPKRGSLNQTESGPLKDNSGYKFVFDFATSQANGQISALGLTSKWGGCEGYGSSQGYGVAPVKTGERMSVPTGLKRYLVSTRMVDAHNNIGYSVLLTADKKLSVAEIRLPITNASLVGDATSAGVLESKTIETTTFGKYDSDVIYIAFLNDGAGNIWGFQHDGNRAGNSSGTATVNWIKINPADWSFTEGTWTFDLSLSWFGFSRDAIGERCYIESKSIIHEGFLYVYSYDQYKIYKINLGNPSDVSTLQFDDGSNMLEIMYTGSYSVSYMNIVGNVIRFSGGYILGGKAYHANSGPANENNAKQGLYRCGVPALRYKNLLFCVSSYNNSTSDAEVAAALMSPYLATINNLPSPVQKTADKTMKITYILREEAE